MIQIEIARDPRLNLETKRLLLRPFQLTDAANVRRLEGAIRVSEQLSRMPHPYPEGRAEESIDGQRAEYKAGKNLNFAITLKESEELMGSIGLHPKEDLFALKSAAGSAFPIGGRATPPKRSLR